MAGRDERRLAPRIPSLDAIALAVPGYASL